jgi:hypothetical protein
MLWWLSAMLKADAQDNSVTSMIGSENFKPVCFQ